MRVTEVKECGHGNMKWSTSVVECRSDERKWGGKSPVQFIFCDDNYFSCVFVVVVN